MTPSCSTLGSGNYPALLTSGEQIKPVGKIVRILEEEELQERARGSARKLMWVEGHAHSGEGNEDRVGRRVDTRA